MLTGGYRRASLMLTLAAAEIHCRRNVVGRLHRLSLKAAKARVTELL